MGLPPALEILNLTKAFPVGFLHRGTRRVLDGLNFQVEPGETFGYLGPNGAGKTTTLKILMGIVFADEGTARVLGHPLEDRAWRLRTGFLPEHPYFYDYLTPVEYLDYAGRLVGMEKSLREDRSNMLLELVGLSHAGRVPMRRFSKGMVQRLGVAQALINDPDLVIMDEPMSGLDPIGRRAVRNLILKLRAEGKTVFFSTHILSDAEALCDRVAVIRGGQIVDVGTLGSILQVGVRHVEIVTSGVPASALDPLDLGLLGHEQKGDQLRLETPEAKVEGVLSAIIAAHGRIVSVQPVRQSLEDYFFKEMGTDDRGLGWSWDD